MTKEAIEEALDLVDKFIFSRDKAVGFLPETKENETIGQWITAFWSLSGYSLCFNDWKKLETIRSVLQSALEDQQVKDETVDLDALKEKMISDFDEDRESELGRGYELGLCHAVVHLSKKFNITRKVK